MGIVSGTGNNYFYPDDPIKREDMAVILAKTFKIIGKPLPNHSDSVLDKYSDKNLISIYALQSMAILNGEGIITGKSSSQLSLRLRHKSGGGSNIVQSFKQTLILSYTLLFINN